MKRKLLIVDDDALMATNLMILIKRWDFDTVTATNGTEALTILHSDEVDLVLSDMRMPEMDGMTLLTKAKEDFPDLPFIMMTAHGSVEGAVDCMRTGAFDYVIKPPTADELKITIERALEHTDLQKENAFLRSEMASMGTGRHRLLGESPAMTQVFDLIKRVARTHSTILISGETGTGKELVAQSIHYNSPRADQPLVACNCAALNNNLLESELFGHEKGAFTGATTSRRGRFEEADQGTLFLDEIGETDLGFQAKLLRVLQEMEFQRVGGNERIKVDVRVIACSNRDLAAEVKGGKFREDLYYRLRVLPIHLPPLRERHGDILPLAYAFLKRFTDQYKAPGDTFTSEAKQWLQSQSWPGNIRELQHTIERAVVLSSSPEIGVKDLQFDTGTQPAEASDDMTLQGFIDRKSTDHILSMLEKTGWKKQKAAELLGIDRATLYRMIKKYQLEKST